MPDKLLSTILYLIYFHALKDYLNQGVKYTQTEQHGQGLVKEVCLILLLK